jgi:hypothetical protein
MLARSIRTAKPLVTAMALLAALTLSCAVAMARPARHGARHKGAKTHLTVSASSRSKHGSHKSGTTKSKKKGSKGTGGSTGGSSGGSGGSTGGSGGSTSGSSGEGTGTELGEATGSEGPTGAPGESTGGSKEGATGGSEGGTPEEPAGSKESTGSKEGSGGSAGGAWIPPKHLTWYWQLQGTVNNGEPVAAYDIDGFDNGAGEVAALHAQGKRVICYIDVGTSESFRPDFSSIPTSVEGNSNGWPGEKWLDIRQLSVLEPIMTARIQMCKEKGFDAVEPDNMDGYENKSGFPLTAQEQLAYDEWVAGEVHALGMSVFQKNDGEQTSQLVSHFDGALDEQCNQYSECSNFQAYLSAGKPVLNAEYSLSASVFCAADNAAGIMGARFSLELDGTSFEPCW